MLRRLRDVLLIDLALINAWHLIVTAGRYWSARRCIEQALSEAQEPLLGEQAGPGSIPSLEGVRPAAPAVCLACGAPIERNRDLGYVTCSTGGPTHFYRWVSEDE